MSKLCKHSLGRGLGVLAVFLVGCANADDLMRFPDPTDTGSQDAAQDTARADAAPDVRADAASDVRADAASSPDVLVGDTGARDTAVPDTGARDTGVAAALYSTCLRDADCGAGSFCLTQFPGGICSRACTGTGTAAHTTCRTAATPSGWCVNGTLVGQTGTVCLPGCTTTPMGAMTPMPDLACNRFGGSCNTLANSMLPGAGATDGVCFPACFPSGTTPPAGEPSCAAGQVCDPYASPLNGSCSASLSPATRTANGGPCTADSDCTGGQCLLEVNATTGAGTGWVGGYCVSRGRQPPQASFVMGRPWPQYDCPMGSVPYLFLAEGDNVPCLRQCNTNTDCRGGFICDHLQPTGMPTVQFFSTGACLPEDCRAAGAPACPAGYRCQTIAGTTQGNCVR